MTPRDFFTGRAVGILVVLLLAVLFFGFKSMTSPEPVPPPIVGENLEGEADPSRMSLGMKTWNWVETLLNDESKFTPRKENVFTLTFGTDGKFTATTDCNSMGGSYMAKDGGITFSNIFATKMYCEGSQEGEFASFLENASGYHFTSRGQLILDLKFDSGSVIFR